MNYEPPPEIIAIFILSLSGKPLSIVKSTTSF